MICRMRVYPVSSLLLIVETEKLRGWGSFGEIGLFVDVVLFGFAFVLRFALHSRGNVE